MRLSERGLWQNRDFLRLWAGETVSRFGSQVTSFAVPLVAAVTLPCMLCGRRSRPTTCSAR